MENRQEGIIFLIKKHFFVGILFVMISLLLYLPWLSNPDIIIAVPGDSFSGLWDAWRIDVASENGQSLTFTKLIAAPIGFSYMVSSLFWSKVQLVSGLLFNEVFTYNFLYFISFPLAAFTMYMLAWHVTKNRIASFIAGFIFSFSPYHLMKSLQHLTLAHIQWLPLFFLTIIKYYEKRSIVNLILIFAIFSILLLSDYYYGFYTIILASLMVCFILIYDRLNLVDRPIAKTSQKKFAIPIVALTLVFLTAAVFPILSNWSKVKALFGRSINELYLYSARPLDYLTPSINNPFFGSFVERFASIRIHESNFFEQTLYLGFVPLVLSVIALIGLRSESDRRHRFLIYFAVCGAVIAFLFSMPPTLQIFDLKIPMPAYFTYMIMPVFRAYSRFGIYLLMFVSILAAIGLKKLISRIESKTFKFSVAGIILALIAIEFINIPPWHVIRVDAKAAPKVYQWLAQQPGDFIVAEYPWTSNIEYSNSEYLFFQRIHKKRLANGAAEGSKADKIRQNADDLQEPDIGIKLYKLGIRYIILHRSKYKEGMIPNKIKRYYGGRFSDINKIQYNFGKVPKIKAKNIILMKKFGSDYLYRVKPVEGGTTSIWGKNVYASELSLNSKNRWMANNGEMIIANYYKKPIIANIKIEMFAFYKPRILSITLGSKSLKRELIKTKPRYLMLKHIRLQPGFNKLIFRTKPGDDIADNKIHNGDKRRLSINVGRAIIDIISK